MATRDLTVPPGAAGQRLDLLIAAELGLSRARLKALFEAGSIRVEGRRAKKGQKVEPGQGISVELEVTERNAAPEPAAPLVVLHEDASLIFVDKPSGRPSHPLEPGEGGTVANALVARFPECGLASEDPREGGLCHRLDIETSGVLLAARRREVWTAMRAAFSGDSPSVDKRYWALVTGPIADQGEVDLPLRHHPRHSDRVQPAFDAGDPGRTARSEFLVLSRAGEYSLVEVQIFTGVLHQVRAHLAAIGAPVVGDRLYGGRPEPGLSRFFLHARSLEVAHPTTKKRIKVVSPLPSELVQVCASHLLSER